MASGRLIDYLRSGLAASRPATPDLQDGGLGLYYATDTSELSVWDGSDWGPAAPVADTVSIITEAAAFTATVATHAGLRKLVLAGGDVTFSASGGYAAGMVFQIRATGSIALSFTGGALEAPAAGTLNLAAGMTVAVVMTSSATGIVMGQVVLA